MGSNTYISHLQIGYNPFTNHLPTSWDIQVGSIKPLCFGSRFLECLRVVFVEKLQLPKHSRSLWKAEKQQLLWLFQRHRKWAQKHSGSTWKNPLVGYKYLESIGKYHYFRQLVLLVLRVSSWWKLTATAVFQVGWNNSTWLRGEITPGTSTHLFSAMYRGPITPLIMIRRGSLCRNGLSRPTSQVTSHDQDDGLHF